MRPSHLQPSPALRNWLPGIGVFALSFFLYWRTLFPTLYTFDSAELVTGAYTLGIVHATGYPLYLLLAKLFTYLPVGDIAYRVNLMSAFFAALTLLILYRVILYHAKSPILSAIAVLLFGFSYYFWSETRAAEVYTLHTFFMACLLLLLFRWREGRQARVLLLFAFLYGLSFSNHMATSLMAFGFLYFLLATDAKSVFTLRNLLGMALLFSLGLLPYLYLPLRFMADPPLNYARLLNVDLTTLQGLRWMLTAEMFQQEMFPYSPQEFLLETRRYLVWLWTNFLGIGAALGLLGLVAMARRDRHSCLLLLLLFLSNSFFFINYRAPDKGTMFLPTFLVWAIWIGVGLAAIEERLLKREGSLKAWPVGSAQEMMRYGCVALVALNFVMTFPRVDASNNWITRRFAERALATVEPNAFIIADWVSATPLEYLQIVEGKGSGITVFDWGLYALGRQAKLRREGASPEQVKRVIEEELVKFVDQTYQQRPVYSIAGPRVLEGHYTLEKVGNNGYFRLHAQTPIEE